MQTVPNPLSVDFLGLPSLPSFAVPAVLTLRSLLSVQVILDCDQVLLDITKTHEIYKLYDDQIKIHVS